LALLESQTYQKAYQKLVKKKTSYNSINQDLHEFFNEHKFDEIWQMRFFLRGNGGVRLLKLRLKNNKQKRGASGGYRLIVRCQQNTKEICLLYIYPKTGPLRQENIEDTFEIKLLKKYNEQRKQGTLVLSNIPI
jgi:mRNA-degrading endonuclease RelE of RelBE toxin-antitoxin system